MACFATPYGLRYAAHCFNRAHAQQSRPALIPAGGKLGVTSHRFKRVVRAAKRLSYELCEIGAINRRLPSFLIECLVYLVEDSYFLFEDDDRFGRLLRVLTRLKVLLADDEFAREATEINEIKILFHVGQAWTLTDARNFVDAALARLTA